MIGITRGEFVAFVLGGLVQRVWPWMMTRVMIWRLERDYVKAKARMAACAHDHVGIENIGEGSSCVANTFIKCADCWALWIEPADRKGGQEAGYWTPNSAKPSERFLLAGAVGIGKEAAEALRKRGES